MAQGRLRSCRCFPRLQEEGGVVSVLALGSESQTEPEKKKNTTLISLALSGSSLPKSWRQAEIRVG